VTQKKVYTRKCSICGRTEVETNIDHRIPRANSITWPEFNSALNKHEICTECHRDKNWLESRMKGFPEDEGLYNVWFYFYAFPEMRRVNHLTTDETQALCFLINNWSDHIERTA